MGGETGEKQNSGSRRDAPLASGSVESGARVGVRSGAKELAECCPADQTRNFDFGCIPESIPVEGYSDMENIFACLPTPASRVPVTFRIQGKSLEGYRLSSYRLLVIRVWSPGIRLGRCSSKSIRTRTALDGAGRAHVSGAARIPRLVEVDLPVGVGDVNFAVSPAALCLSGVRDVGGDCRERGETEKPSVSQKPKSSGVSPDCRMIERVVPMGSSFLG